MTTFGTEPRQRVDPGLNSSGAWKVSITRKGLTLYRNKHGRGVGLVLRRRKHELARWSWWQRAHRKIRRKIKESGLGPNEVGAYPIAGMADYESYPEPFEFGRPHELRIEDTKGNVVEYGLLSAGFRELHISFPKAGQTRMIEVQVR